MYFVINNDTIIIENLNDLYDIYISANQRNN